MSTQKKKEKKKKTNHKIVAYIYIHKFVFRMWTVTDFRQSMRISKREKRVVGKRKSAKESYISGFIQPFQPHPQRKSVFQFLRDSS